MTEFAVDQLVLTPQDIDLSRSPLAGKLEAETHVLGAFNPGLTRLPNGNLLLMVRVAEALKKANFDGHVHAIRWDAERGYTLEGWPLEFADLSDPRAFELRGFGWKVKGPTSLSWLLPVELSADGLSVVEAHYDRAIAPQGSFQCYGIEDPRISRIGERWLMTTGSASPERQSTTLYSSDNGLDWTFEGMVLDHPNKDLAIFEGLIGGRHWAQTRPLGQQYFAYPPGSPFHAGPSINLATSPDALHWKPHLEPHIRPHAGTPSTARIGVGNPPILTEIAGKRGWLTLWHGVEPKQIVGAYRTYWSLLDPEEPWKVVVTAHPPLIKPNPDLTEPLREQIYIDDVVFTSGVAEHEDGFIVASGEADLACRITHVPRDAFVPSEDAGEQ
jgi:beta-1,2-mannobiose phosphorylase / 1,2-beta-oligomannan phosphorylase